LRLLRFRRGEAEEAEDFASFCFGGLFGRLNLYVSRMQDKGFVEGICVKVGSGGEEYAVW
jgi:hypothetical protein